MRSLALVLLLGLLTPSLDANADNAREDAMLSTAETSMLVTGTVDITADGKVARYAVDQDEKLPKAIVNMVARVAPKWTFAPVNLPENTIGRWKMTLLFVAKRLESGGYSLQLRDAQFLSPAPEESASIDKKYMRYPHYPHAALSGASIPGTVYLAVRFDRSGRVLDVAVEQVNLRTLGSGAQMARWRTALGKACLDAAKRWRFNVPATAFDAGQDSGIGRIPVSFMPEGAPLTGYGEWEAYIPGPRSIIPWLQNTPLADTRPDAQTSGDFNDGRGRRLLTPLEGG
jgi:hypothetical protein